MIKSLLNLGCGRLMLPNADNVDSSEVKNPPYPYIKQDVISYLTECYPTTLYKKIVAYYFLEHLTTAEASFCAYLINQALIMDGIFEFTIPDFYLICQAYLNGSLSLRSAEFDVLSPDEGSLGTHKSLWNESKVKELFCQEGFILTQYLSPIGVRQIGAHVILQKVAESGTPRSLFS